MELTVTQWVLICSALFFSFLLGYQHGYAP